MAYTEYTSEDASAPALDGLAGSLANLLDKILVDGYGSKAPLGWATEFTGTNKRVYRAATGTSRMRLRIDDTANATDARFLGYESMTDVDTGTGPFPTNVQVSGGLYARKSIAASSTTRPWYACGTEKWFYLQMFAQQTVYGGSAASDGTMFFAELESLLPGDIYNTLIIGRSALGSSNENFGGLNSTGGTVSGHYIPRGYTGVLGAKLVGKSARAPGGSGGYCMGAALIPYPSPISGRIPLSKIDIFESVTGGVDRRLIMPPEIRAPLMIQPADIFDTFDGEGGLSGNLYRMLTAYSGSSVGRVAFKAA